MTILGIRFRVEGDTVVLQVQVPTTPAYTYHQNTTWRDAKVEDLLEVGEFCKTDMYESINMQIKKLHDDLFDRFLPPRVIRERPYTDEEMHQMDFLNQHQGRDE